ncbi:SRPBCC family protein [uncultured Tateyamaria sp.]|uniref:SRPBCC family protein n=1 Tax=uncultured Tateyamaria sp. TaxID=455651 RepID=UPI002626176D|nr:SRPBCC family protein [uncultured Tateyamaria sp.]
MSVRSAFVAALLVVPLAGAAAAGTGISPPIPYLTYASQTSDIPAPPELAAQKSYLTNTETATFTGTVAGFRAFLDANPITDFVVATDAIPAIEGITYLSGTWPEVGALRRVDLAGGHSVHERVLTNTDDTFAYQIWNITAPSGRAISHIMGQFHYDQSGDEVTVTWDYNIKPSIFVARPAIRGFLRDDFGPFMEAGLTGVVAAYQQ